MLSTTSGPLIEEHDLVMLDLDGVVYVGGEGVPRAAESLAAAREAGVRLAFVTNNASRPPSVVADHLTGVGVPAEVDDVVTSAQAAARTIRDRFGPDARVVALGAAGLHDALAEQGLQVVGVGEEGDVLATGYGPDVLWRDIMAAAVAVRDGLPWVASNTDRTIPTSFGVAPGHGVLVEMLARFAEVDPVVAGKPSPPLLRTTIERCSGERPLMVGDRIDTDIDGGIAVDVPTLLVMTGVSDAAALASCPPASRPSYVAADLAGLLEPQPEVVVEDGRARAGGWTADLDAEETVSGTGSASDWWRALAVALWHHLDTTGSAFDVARIHSHPPVPGDDTTDR